MSPNERWVFFASDSKQALRIISVSEVHMREMSTLGGVTYQFKVQHTDRRLQKENVVVKFRKKKTNDGR